jgi:two-component system response regulator YesN
MASKNISDLVIQHVMTVPDQEFADLSVSTLAYSFNIDRYTLSRQFKRQTHMTLEHFLYKEKMSRAAFLLKAHDGIKVKEVSARMGFCTCDYFIRKFKEFYGILPGKYKEFKTGVPESRDTGSLSLMEQR